MNQSPEPRSFSNRVRSNNTHVGVIIVEEENNFPFVSIDFVRIGSAHQAITDPSQEQGNIELLEKLINHVMARFEPEHSPSPIVVEHK